MKQRRSATDHRAVVLESVATNPSGASMKEIVKDCNDDAFTPDMISSMVWQLRKEGLVGIDDQKTGHFITKAGLDYLMLARFDRALPEPGAPRLRARGRKKQKSN